MPRLRSSTVFKVIRMTVRAKLDLVFRGGLVERVVTQYVDWRSCGDHRKPPVCVRRGRVKVGSAFLRVPTGDGETTLRGCRELEKIIDGDSYHRIN